MLCVLMDEGACGVRRGWCELDLRSVLDTGIVVLRMHGEDALQSAVVMKETRTQAFLTLKSCEFEPLLPDLG